MDITDRKWWIGTSGWSYTHWQGIFYPEDLKGTEWLSYYSHHFSTVEVNSSFYRLPFKGMVSGWLRRTPDNFRFVIKGSRRVTHFQKLRDIKEPLNSLLERIEPLREKMLCILWQFPPSLKLDLTLLEEFLAQLPDRFRYAIEFRHPSWSIDKTFYTLKKYEVAHCTISAPHLPCNLITTTDFAYLRLHGINSWYTYNYTEDDLLWWSEALMEIGKKVCKVLCYFNNDFNAYSVWNALRLRELLKSN